MSGVEIDLGFWAGLGVVGASACSEVVWIGLGLWREGRSGRVSPKSVCVVWLRCYILVATTA